MSQPASRTYERHACIAFRRTSEEFGGLSNMAPGFPLKVNGILIRTSEALYQACRFPHKPDVQRTIIEQKSPMTAKMKSKPYREQSRPDWEQVRVKIMMWCLRVKLAQNWTSFSKLLLSTGKFPIVEESTKDDFWGAKPIDANTLTGKNVLGRLLMKLREELRGSHTEFLRHVEPLALSNFLLLGQPIAAIRGQVAHRGPYASTEPRNLTPSEERTGIPPPTKHLPTQGDWLSHREISSEDAASSSMVGEAGDEILIVRQNPAKESQQVPLSLGSLPPSHCAAATGELILSHSLNLSSIRELDDFCQQLRERLRNLGPIHTRVELVVGRLK